MRISFTKMQGAGNDFVVLDGTAQPLHLSSEQLQNLGDRRFGVGADQILLVERSSTPGVDFRYRIFNGANGAEVEHCGNGARCFVRFVHERGLTQQRRVRVETVNNLLELTLEDDGRVSVDMNAPIFEAAALPFDPSGLQPRLVDGPTGPFELWPLAPDAEAATVSMGNPHAVLVVPNAEAAPVHRLGPQLERHPRFERRVNVGFMQVVARDHIKLRVFERDAGETLACGTGACAAVVAGIRLGLLDERVDVDTHGGRLTIAWAGVRQGLQSHVLMTGPAQTVFEGEIEL
jgi:diaminopimelate epimerase